MSLGVHLPTVQSGKKIVDRAHAGGNSGWTAVFEADAIMREDFAQRNTALQAQLDSVEADIILMGHCFESCPSSYQGALDIGGGVHVVHSNHPVCTHAYLISASGAKRLLGLTVPMKMAVDERIRATSNDGRLRSLSSCPPIARQPWQKEREMFTGTDDGVSEFILRGGSLEDFPRFMAYVKNLHG
jgi:GR25 family glycosyltransferase involved in LPS biosynthesis